MSDDKKAEFDTKLLPAVSLDLRLPSEGNSMLKINGDAIYGVTNCKVELDAEKMFPTVTITFVAKQIQLEMPSVLLTTSRPIVQVPVINKEK